MYSEDNMASSSDVAPFFFTNKTIVEIKGLIKHDSRNQAKYFFHVSQVLEEVTENDKVTYELEQGLKGMNAVKVKKV